MGRFEGIIGTEYDLIPQALLGYVDLQEDLASRIRSRYDKPLVVDIGVGTGITTEVITNRIPGCFVVGVDCEGAMVDQARRRLASIPAAKTHLVVSDALDFVRGLGAESVDVVASAFVLHNCLAVYRALLEVEILRVLRPGGMFINCDKYAADDWQEYVRELTNQLIRYDALRECGREDLRRIWIGHEIEDQDPQRIMWTEEALTSLRHVGFVDVSLVRRMGQYAVVTSGKRKSASTSSLPAQMPPRPSLLS
jgi:tRNA (cmo5U34)-methyltransferase